MESLIAPLLALALSAAFPNYGDLFGWRGARIARREEGECRVYLTDEQRREAGPPPRGLCAVGWDAGCIASRMSPQLGKSALSLKDLQNFTFDLGANSNVEGGKVPLLNGKWTDRDGGSSFTLHPMFATGDLNRDGDGDAVAILVESAGGTGSFFYMFAILNRNGKPVQADAPEWLGDRSVIQRLSIDRSGVITVRYLTQGDRDPSCCPTMRIEDRYRVEDGKLVGIMK